MQEAISKNIRKSSINKVFDKILLEKKDALYEVFMEAIEDYALLRAMEEGSNTKKVSKKKIMSILNKA